MELESIGSVGAARLSRRVHAAYAREYPPGPDFEGWRDGVWARHRERPGFSLVVGREDGDIVGLAWGYVGDRGQYWSDWVSSGVPASVAREWIGGHFEVAELLVAPDHRRHGVGRSLLGALLERTTASRALLTVRDSALAAHALYASSGWIAIGRLEPDVTVMGLHLAHPHPASTPSPEPGR
jgi:ribosomal protein S18 acetylase RimI-like enzyme